MVSIILPTYNRRITLTKAVDSVLSQTYRDFELIIVDDGSNDGTDEAVRAYEDGRVRYIRTELNRGAAAARNCGISHISGDAAYIAFEDSDDLWHPDKLERQIQAIEEQPEAGFCYHKIRYDMGGGRTAILPDERVPLERKSGDIYSQLLYENMCDCPAMLIKRELLERVGAFDEGLRALEDYELALRLAKAAPAAFVDDVLLESAYSLTGVSGSAANYLISSCMILGRYKADYLASGHFDHRVEVIVADAERAGMKEQIVRLLETVMRGQL